MAEPEVDRRLLRQLELMGFPTHRATTALYSTGNCNLEAALDWVIRHPNDSDIDHIPPLIQINIEIEDADPLSLPEELKLEPKKMWDNVVHSTKVEERKTLPEVEKVTKAMRETTIHDPKNTEDERERILSRIRTKRDEYKGIREKQLKEDQKERMRTNTELVEGKRRLEESQRKRSLAQTDLEKEDDRRARERIRRRIEDDKAERNMKLGFPKENSKAAQPIIPPINEKPNENPKAAQPIVPPINEKKEAGTLLVKPEQLKDCLRSLKRNHKDENAKVKRAFQTLLRIVGNIAKNPDEDKYRRIRLSNPSFQEKVGNFKGSIEFLELCGFEKAEQGDELYLLMLREKINLQLLNWAGNELLSALSNPYLGLLSQ